MIRKKIIFLSLILSLAVIVATTGVKAANNNPSYGPNLISNPSAEISSSTLPQDWYTGRWGTNQVNFDFNVPGSNSARGLLVRVDNCSSGDAKWYFKEVSITAGHTYQFADEYKADTTSYIYAQFRDANGKLSYKALASLKPKTVYTPFNIEVTAPTGATTLTVFHLLKSSGSLATDNYSVKEILPADPENLISNSFLERAETSGQPSFWLQGRFGSSTPTFTYSTVGAQDRGVKVTLADRASGDAKWYFSDILAAGGSLFSFADEYQSNIPSTVMARFKLSNGTYQYSTLGSASTSPSWQKFTSSFQTPANTTALTIFHLIKDNGWLSTDNYNLKKINPNLFDQGYVSINFDDGRQSIYDSAIPALDQAGFKSTNYIVVNYMQASSTDFMSKPKVLEIKNHGHEIGSHTISHADLPLLTIEQAQKEIVESKQILEAEGLGPINSFCYPFGDYTEEIRQLVASSSYTGARSTLTSTANYKTTDPYLLHAWSITVNTPIDSIKSAVDDALAKKTWLIMTFHRVDDSGTVYSVTPDFFRQVVDYLKQKNVAVITNQQGLTLMRQ